AARADIDQRVLDEEKTGEIKVVSSDGSTVQIIYLKLKTYTLTYAASGASPSLQTKVCKYGAVINNAGISVPQKDMNEFKGWFYDAGFENAVAVGTDKVVADTQLYAKFETKHYKLIFDFNIGSESNQLPDDENRTVAVNSYNLFDHVISWDVDRLFAESFGFTQSDGTGRYEIDYTVNNLSANKSITGIKPSAIGYTFGGWYTEGTNTQTNVIRRPNANTDDVIVLVAKWTPAMFTMRFDKQDGSRITTKSVRNMAAWDEILPAEPSRTGYIFEGWYITTDEESEHFNSVYEASTCQDNDGNWLFSISDFANSGFYGSVTAGFNFSSLTVYAVWQSVDVEIKKICAHGDLAFYRDGEELTSTDPVYIGDTISVEVDVDNGYEFRNLIVGGRALTNGITTFTVAERNVMSGVDDIGEGYNYITVEAVFVEERYTIEYDTDGGKAADSTFARTYTASNIGADSINRAKLPSLLTKRGYDFAGWIFATTEIYETPDPAFETDCDLENLYGADLWLKKPFDNIYRDVTLKAVWTPQRAEVYLYNATYSGVYNKDTVDTSRYAIHDFGGDDIVTGMDIDITNPSRGESFVFLGWATTRNGAVVYPAEEGTTVISYRVNPHKDEKGNLLNQNNLYAVWH
ncbi:MAG: InlB B-repeat-containing protein, partial [Clostridia bacterium]|nr:InlB B-repeat-containing protein [Clostridia bacterium]